MTRTAAHSLLAGALLAGGLALSACKTMPSPQTPPAGPDKNDPSPAPQTNQGPSGGW